MSRFLLAIFACMLYAAVSIPVKQQAEGSLVAKSQKVASLKKNNASKSENEFTPGVASPDLNVEPDTERVLKDNYTLPQPENEINGDDAQNLKEQVQEDQNKEKSGEQSSTAGAQDHTGFAENVKHAENLHQEHNSMGGDTEADSGADAEANKDETAVDEVVQEAKDADANAKKKEKEAEEASEKAVAAEEEATKKKEEADNAKKEAEEADAAAAAAKKEEGDGGDKSNAAEDDTGVETEAEDGANAEAEEGTDAEAGEKGEAEDADADAEDADADAEEEADADVEEEAVEKEEDGDDADKDGGDADAEKEAAE